ncbi:hypothetical protein LJR290_007649 [Variovorax sp. LjRoot290]|uniref:hypothetical protein n=1 Tax=Variovorax sp. LjRoot290 TaxID=3342316 RepID=UPI003ECFBC32
MTHFGEAQFKLFEQLLVAARPRILVIVNALASRLYLQVRSATVRANEDLGCHIDVIADRKVPVLFSGFPTYMDHFTRARLEWHMRHVLTQLSLTEKAAALDHIDAVPETPGRQRKSRLGARSLPSNGV